MSAEPALRTDADLLQCLITGLSSPFRHKFGSAVDAPFHRLLVLQLRELRADDTNDDVLILGQVLERLEAACPFRVVLQVEGVDVKVLEKLARNFVIRPLSEVSATNEVASTEMNSGVQIRGAFAYGVIV